ncbi:MAG: hypothetical protein HY866_04355 [Chloroflexi bacterium]|nr:hypothetical protein [Chloroflexota bacterium]
MGDYTRPVTEIIRQRFSYREYLETPIDGTQQQQLREFMDRNPRGPWEAPQRFELVAALEHDRASLKRLGTYGFIKNPMGFIVGGVHPGEKYLEDFGYVMERFILYATGIGLGTCWLGARLRKAVLRAGCR